MARRTTDRSRSSDDVTARLKAAVRKQRRPFKTASHEGDSHSIAPT